MAFRRRLFKAVKPRNRKIGPFPQGSQQAQKPQTPLNYIYLCLTPVERQNPAGPKHYTSTQLLNKAFTE